MRHVYLSNSEIERLLSMSDRDCQILDQFLNVGREQGFRKGLVAGCAIAAVYQFVKSIVHR